MTDGKTEEIVTLDSTLKPQNSLVACPTCLVRLKPGVDVKIVGPNKYKSKLTRTFECPKCDYKEGPFDKRKFDRRIIRWVHLKNSKTRK